MDHRFEVSSLPARQRALFLCAAQEKVPNILVRSTSALGYTADIVGGLSSSVTTKAAKPVIRLGSTCSRASSTPGSHTSVGFGAQVLASSSATILSAIIFGLKS